MLIKKGIWLFIFSVSMGFFESSVVVYLRELYYPEGFSLPIKTMATYLALTELFREAATLIMLIAIAAITGKTFVEKFSAFLFSFAVWDIFYYIFLKLILNWPESFFTWDILFLIPMLWASPVLAPIIISFIMIFFAVAIMYFRFHGKDIIIQWYEWVLLITGSVIVIFSFTRDSWMFFWCDALNFENAPNYLEFISFYRPYDFSWLIFGFGALIIISAIEVFYFRNKISKNSIN
ncbi:MAG: hypothetical protein A2275_09495 [Bacteroidetes bacterium RIFOXYA12_FULL_35_11]|nr:MAG: hypothetical protein A2X01_06200 [Bacteroidetes bacterium GWF2_35_48]OFY78653.1 MAG: hypothetical protein A2275_09495 [Bacteroidetes bacterium RIFOXYA12_FULL_35_11]OFY95257.1 MAG: hypothetical protein A2309_03015 [Bacteroidetes bacterium RIFOXYB2_FULL_35_7]OFZ04838.1 MAG: hypothetical protein A2491_05615 [Bacteroidetes bacterium RIFOXYC12_FULL_35_7]HBX52735.1 hypothetical protein [Bacteroidales bacterium]